MRVYLLIVSLLGMALVQPVSADTGDYSKGTCISNWGATRWVQTNNATWEDCHGNGWWLLTPTEIDALLQQQQGGNGTLTKEDVEQLVSATIYIFALAFVVRVVRRQFS